MMQLDIFDTSGKSVGKQKLEESVFGVKPNKTLLAQYVRVFMANKRQGTSKVKPRAEVAGGGIKPWAQKGTGRARHGSIRSPIWVGGGITHGPLQKDHSLSLPKKMRKAAFISALSLKASGGDLKILEKLDSKKTSKTKDLNAILKNLELAGNILFVMPEKNDKVLKSGKNIKGLNVSLSENLNTFEVLRADKVLFLQEALEKTQKRYKGK